MTKLAAASRRARVLWTARTVWEAWHQARLPFLPKTAIRETQERRIRAAVVYAHTHVPYYRETMRRLILAPQDFRSADDLARLPLIEREQLQRDPEYFLSEQWPAAACVLLQSGGSTGAPVAIFRDPPSFFVEAGYYARQRLIVARLAGRRLRYREALIVPEDSSAASIVSEFRTGAQLPRNLQGRLRIFSMLSSPSELVPELEEYRPEVITSYGSYLDSLFGHLREHGKHIPSARVAVFMADSVSIVERDWARDALGVAVVGNYGAIEATHIGFECERHCGYHVNVDAYPMRLIENGGGEPATGAPGEVVVSNLVNRGTVLLNYRLGDLASWVAEQCPCGRNLPLSSYLDRTKLAWLDLGLGRMIHAQALRLILRKRREIYRYQIVQEARRRFLLRLVPAPGCDRESTSSGVLAQFRRQLGDSVAVRVEFVSELPTSPAGKVDAVVPL